MNKVIIFYGPKSEFERIIPSDKKNLTNLIMEIDNDSKNLTLFTDKDREDINPPPKITVKNFVIESSEYAGVREHVIQNFVNFIARLDIGNMYLHNPPLQISSQVERVYQQVEIIKYKYKSINREHILKIHNQYEDVIKGQSDVKKSLLKAIFPLLNKKRKLPIVILFYGDTGLGKTETAKFLSNIVGENLFRKQFSMYQNNQFATYLFGGNHSEPSFAKDLLNRESNIMLLDEFDKANATFHSAFYQLFDDGIFEDQNYSLELYKSIIICTSNYKSEKEIRNNLGNAIFARFDAVIGFDGLSECAKVQILELQFEKQIDELEKEDQNIIHDADLFEKIKGYVKYYSNAREIAHIVENTISDLLLNKIIEKQS